MSRSTKTTLIIGLISFFLATAVFVLTVYQVNRQGVQLNLQRENMAAELAQQDSFSRLQRLSDSSLAQRQELQDLFLVSKSDSIDFLNSVESLAPQLGVVLETERVEEQVEVNEPSWVVISFSFTGPRLAVENFVRVLETLPYVSRIDNLNLTNTSGSEWKVETTMRVQFLNYDS